MSDLEKKAKEYAHMVENYKKLSITPSELSRYHSISEQQFDERIGQLEDSIQKDINDIPKVLKVFNKILLPLKKVSK